MGDVRLRKKSTPVVLPLGSGAESGVWLCSVDRKQLLVVRHTQRPAVASCDAEVSGAVGAVLRMTCPPSVHPSHHGVLVLHLRWKPEGQSVSSISPGGQPSLKTSPTNDTVRPRPVDLGCGGGRDPWWMLPGVRGQVISAT